MVGPSAASPPTGSGARPRSLVEPVDEEELVALAEHLDGLDAPVLVLGRGSNLLVADRGFDGLVVALGSGFDSLAVDGRRARAGAAVALPVLARRTVSAGLRGLEWAVGVPGSVGGAVRMNAGGHGSDTAATLVGCRWVDLDSGAVHESPADALGLSYRESRLAPTDVVTSATYELDPGGIEEGQGGHRRDRALATGQSARWQQRRVGVHQPGGRLRRPPHRGMRPEGVRMGSATVSSKHANFFQADLGGSADDVRRLIAHVQARVASATGVELRTEVRLVGFEDEGSTGR